MYRVPTIGKADTYELDKKNKKLIAHGYTWDIISITPYVHNGDKRLSVRAKKPRGRRSYVMVIFSNGVISSAV